MFAEVKVRDFNDISENMQPIDEADTCEGKNKTNIFGLVLARQVGYYIRG